MDFASENLKWLSYTTSFWRDISAPHDAQALAEYLRSADLSGMLEDAFNQALGVGTEGSISQVPTLITWNDRAVTATANGTFVIDYTPKEAYEVPNILISADPIGVYLRGVNFSVRPAGTEKPGTYQLEFFTHPAEISITRKFVGLYASLPRNVRASWASLPPCDADQATLMLQYQRGLVTDNSLTAACAAAAGERVFPFQTTVVGLQQKTPTEVLLYLDSGAVVSAKPDSEFAVENAIIPAGEVASGRVGVSIARRSTPAWWRTLPADWLPKGLALNHLDETGEDPYSAPLIVPDRMVQAWVVSSDPGDVAGEKSHVRFSLDGESADADLFFARMHARETETGNYLNSRLQLPVSGKKVLLNPLDVMFQYCYGFKSVILYLHPGVDRFYDCLDFFRENIPLGFTPLISYGGGLSSAIPGSSGIFIFDPSENSWHSSSFEAV